MPIMACDPVSVTFPVRWEGPGSTRGVHRHTERSTQHFGVHVMFHHDYDITAEGRRIHTSWYIIQARTNLDAAVLRVELLCIM